MRFFVIIISLFFFNTVTAQEYHPDINIPDEDAPVAIEAVPVPEAEIPTRLILDIPPPKKKWYDLGGWSGSASLKKGKESVMVKKRIKLPIQSRRKTRKKTRYRRPQQRTRMICPLFGF